MNKPLSLLLFLLAVLCNSAFSQGCPSNIDFEQGDFSHWQCSIGKTFEQNGKNVISLSDTTPLPGRHEIVAADTGVTVKDPYGNFPVVCPYGGKYSVKLGNNNTGAEAEGISYTFTVPTGIDTFTFTYFYAVVFENPSHTLPEQPRFFVTAYEVPSGAVINCASYNYVATSGLPGFEKSLADTTILFKRWSPVSIQFAGLAGHKVRLEFKTADCTLGGHFGYAYLDVGTGCSNVLATAPFCPETNSLILNAPYGFKTYTWYNADYTKIVGNDQSLTLTPPPATSGVFHVDIIPYPGFGCRDTADAAITTLPVPDTPSVQNVHYCQGDAPVYLTANHLRSTDLYWYTSATGGTGNPNNPLPQTTTAGTTVYYVTQKELFGCESLRIPLPVTVGSKPVTNFTANITRQCYAGNSFAFTNNTTNLSKPVYMWRFGDDSTSTDTDAVHSYNKYGIYPVSLTATNDSACSTTSRLQVTVVPPPVAAFTVPPVICQDETSVSFADQSSVPAGLSSINSWWWSIDGKIFNGKTPPSFIATVPGPFAVKQVVTTAEGCRSDTNALILNVRYKPTAALTYGTLLCDNEGIAFTDKSTLPQQATGEAIAKWYWSFNNTITDGRQNPLINLPAAYYDARLVAETNFGCKSDAADSFFTIHPKPRIQLKLNDSCVVVRINMQGEDLLNTVDKWYWDFGGGLTQKPNVVTRYYAEAGNYPFTLIGQTVFGCKDTVLKPLVIYDNKSFAGKDTLAAMGQPVQLNANGGPTVTYTWQPATGLNNANIENPVATLDYDQVYRLYSVSDKGCRASSSILIKRMKGAALYIPTGFTPNADKLNDVLKVMPVGIKAFNYFAVFNRWGQRVFYSNDFKQGWDGNFMGSKAPSGNYVAVASAVDYLGKPMLEKVNVVLIR